MITLFEKYISQFYINPTIDNIASDLGVSLSQYEKIADVIISWYYDEYHMTFLGAGSYGAAFRINGKDRVLKITSDLVEAANVSYLAKKVEVKGIAEYHDIHKVNVSIDDKFRFSLYSIIMERLYSISNMEKEIFMFVFKNYFKTKNGEVDLYSLDCISKEQLQVSWKEFYQLNPKDIDSFIEREKGDLVLKKYDIDEVKRLSNIYYDDIMNMIYSSFKYNLNLSDIHSNNICRTENDDHVKLIDVGGYSTDKDFKTKSADINININSKIY